MFDYRDIAEEITAADEQENPGYGADDVVMGKGKVVHFADACHKGGKSADYGNEAGQENGFMPVFGIEIGRFVHMLLFDGAALGMDQPQAKLFADHIVAGVAEDGRYQENGDDDFYIHAVRRGGGQGAAGKEKGIAGQEGRYHESSFAENDQE